MRADFLADTNLLIYIHEGNPSVSPFLSYEFAISFISEIELLGFNDLSVQVEKS
jgi:predicted nucleic acid-binding protein